MRSIIAVLCIPVLIGAISELPNEFHSIVPVLIFFACAIVVLDSTETGKGLGIVGAFFILLGVIAPLFLTFYGIELYHRDDVYAAILIPFIAYLSYDYLKPLVSKIKTSMQSLEMNENTRFLIKMAVHLFIGILWAYVGLEIANSLEYIGRISDPEIEREIYP